MPFDSPDEPQLPQDTESSSVFTVKLPRFEGPLDLLLHLIKRDEVDIYDIPIARITQEYLATLDLMKELDLEVAGEFLVMAATLIRIKVQMLLPRPALEEEEELDPREELVRRLLEYRKFKEAAERLKEREEDRRRMFERGDVPVIPEDGVALVDVSLFDLLDGLRDVLRRLSEVPVHQVELDEVSIEEMMDRLRGALAADGRVLFKDLLSGVRSRLEAIVTFMALLELMRLGEAEARQEETFGDIWIFRGYAFGAGIGAEPEADR
jgi:segregation and condensation protein A